MVNTASVMINTVRSFRINSVEVVFLSFSILNVVYKTVLHFVSLYECLKAEI